MITSDRISLECILQHKDYFDEKLIAISQKAILDTNKLNRLLVSANESNKQLKNQLKSLSLQSKNFEKQYKLEKNRADKLEQEKINILEEIERLRRLVDEQEKIINDQVKKIEKIEKDINRIRFSNSDTSNFPTSFDVCSHNKPKKQINSRIKSNNPRGGQKKHPLHKSVLSEDVDYIKTYIVKKAPTGAVAHHDADGNIDYYVTQTIDLKIGSVITESRYFIDQNGDDLDANTHKKYAINPVVYSESFKAATVYLNQKGTIPLQRLSDILNTISKNSIHIGPSTIAKWNIECSKKSAKEKEAIIEDILTGAVIHVDETGFKQYGETRWMHTMVNEKGAVFFSTKDRSGIDDGPISWMQNYFGIALHDHFKSYYRLTNCLHAECNAHIDRYLRSGYEFDKSEACQQMLELLHEILHHKKELINEGIFRMQEEELQGYSERYDLNLTSAIEQYEKENPNVKAKYVPEYIKVFKRLLKNKEEHLRFAYDFRVPYTNNLAEKECRVIKTKKNISKQFVSEESSKAYANILSIIETARIRNENALETLERVFQ